MGDGCLAPYAIRSFYTWGASVMGKGVCRLLDRRIGYYSFIYFGIRMIVLRSTCFNTSVFYYATAGTSIRVYFL